MRIMNKYSLFITSSFKKDYKKIVKRGYDTALLNDTVELLLKGEKLPEKYKDHALSGNWQGYRECHVAPDWLLIYEIINDRLILSLTGTGTHSDLF
ncbi:MAG: type II toxin-antitoxin system YafQ family toxin [Oscillospiraceae bacterium]|nr:type II toxin-antitoxin system YafQ family toxin [Oscillospiraceae bacterium]